MIHFVDPMMRCSGSIRRCASSMLLTLISILRIHCCLISTGITNSRSCLSIRKVFGMICIPQANSCPHITFLKILIIPDECL